MFGVLPIRTRSNYTEAAPSGLPPRPSAVMGAESALQRTRSLLEGVARQHKYVMSKNRLGADHKADELAALSLLRSLLQELETGIMENENPPPSVSKRKALIKVEKARRGVLAAVRECACHVTESQKLFEQIERFIELRPEEPVSPRNFNIKWTRKANTSRNVTKRREPFLGRHKRTDESLVMSIAGLSAIAEGGERDTPKSDAAGPTSQIPPAPAPRDKLLSSKTAPKVGTVPTPKRVKDGEKRGAAQDTATASASGSNSAREYDVGPAAAAAAADNDAVPAVQTVHDASLLLQQMQVQPRRTSDSEDDLRASLSHDVVPSADTMCNIDSCISGLPQRVPTSAVAAAPGCDAGVSNLRVCGTYEDRAFQQGADDEVNSAEREESTPDHRVSLLGSAKRAAAAAVAAAAAAAANRSTASTPLRRPEQGRGPGSAELVPRGSTQVAAAVSLAPARDGSAIHNQDTVTPNRNYFATEPRQHASAADIPVAPDDVQLPLPLPSSLSPEHIFGTPGHQVDHFAPTGLMESPLPDRGQAAAPDAEIDAIPLVAAVTPPELAITPPPRYVRTRHHHNRGSGAAETAVLPPVHYGPHPAHAAAVAAAAAHPYGANGFPHPHIQPLHLHLHHYAAPDPADAYADAASSLIGPYSLRASLPCSLRDFPVAVPPGRQGSLGGVSGPGGAVVAAPRPGTRYAAGQPPPVYLSLDSGQFNALAAAWDNLSLAETEPAAGAQPQQGRRGKHRRGGGLLGVMRSVVGFVGVSLISGAAMALGAAAINTSLDEQEAAAARQRQKNGARQRLRRGGGDDLIPQRTLQKLRSPDLLALGRG
ncbi:hypothetical protein VOLCADRAFT_104528 [Volvox carteri f. nagariensis]|uniref:Uncharacterized protein n=1 Tax=Volvox carteri f. nagariensis TaxID=3068 RepID=D8TU77_VOLCA|nr:uncharacterized protein VOLCADRAFT_104528 [Volvox carteri f. nagariensis]EFJ48988.1 hypothetical protein VOLCADRAFT_104528 [Volvox carteri f. nagariensis]|eukprot:XP_002949885.1 hypothetical protein VOLCADRAFT_104528 [Volvox carteri f. nagariensis]